MKWLWSVLFPVLAWGQMHEILRPTTDVDSSVPISPCVGIYAVSFSMPNAWDNAGLSTVSNQSILVNTKTVKFRARLITTWATTTQTYTSLNLNINSASSGGSGAFSGDAYLFYSLNNGSTWTTVLSDNSNGGWPQQTSTISLSPSQALSTIKVAVCVDAGSDGTTSGFDNVQVWDIWTDGVYSPPATPTPIPPPPATVTHPTVISRMKFPLDIWVIWLSGKLW